jgi:hypothetical protein
MLVGKKVKKEGKKIIYARGAKGIPKRPGVLFPVVLFGSFAPFYSLFTL